MHKVLVIAYYWPPAGGPGVQRWLKFTKYLPESGIEPIVFVPKNADYPILDDSLLQEVPEHIKVIKHPIFEPYKLASIFSKGKTKRISSGIIKKEGKQSIIERFLLWVRGNFFIPDARKYWVKPSVRFLEKYIATNSIETIITTGPPHSVHLIGLRLKQLLQVQWIADFRDPWTNIGYHSELKLSSSSQKKHLKLESQVLNRADKLVVTSQNTMNEFSAKTNRPIRVITNGYDGDLPDVRLDNSFTISHIGSLLTDRNPEALWKVLGELVLENEAFKEQLRIQLIGVVGEEVLSSMNKNGLKSFVSNLGYMKHESVVGYQTKSQVLLLAEIDDAKTQGIIPGKLFEYMKANRPILALGPENWEAGEIVQQTQSGEYVQAHDENAIKKVVLDWFEHYQSGRLKIKSKDIEKYHRRELTRNLAEYILWESS